MWCLYPCSFVLSVLEVNIRLLRIYFLTLLFRNLFTVRIFCVTSCSENKNFCEVSFLYFLYSELLHERKWNNIYLFAGRYGYCTLKRYWRGCCKWRWWRWCTGSAIVSKQSEVHISCLLWQSWCSLHMRLIRIHQYCATNMSSYKQLWTIFHYRLLFYKFVVGDMPPFISQK